MKQTNMSPIPEKPLDRFYALYEDGHKTEKAPQGYIDYFKAAKFLLDEIDSLRQEDMKKLYEKVSRQVFRKIAQYEDERDYNSRRVGFDQRTTLDLEIIQDHYKS